MSTFIFINYNFLGNIANNSVQDKKNSTINNTQEDIGMSNGYLLVDPINISSWTDWELYPFITGNGTDLNPFIIENIEIIGVGVKTMQSGNRTLLNFTYGGIFINANGSFLIRNCKISQTSIGIHLSIGVSLGSFQYQITNVEITDCGIGIYSRWPHFELNISNCYISNCNRITTATIDLTQYLDHGGIGIWVRLKEGSVIGNNHIEDCSIGMMAEAVEFIHDNEFINCGIVPGMIISDYDNSNTVNGKPIGLFWGIDNLVFTQTDASQYGQLIFINCANLTLSNIHITNPCSIGIQLYSFNLFQKTYMNNIICENQNLGFFITGGDVIGDNLYAKNCKAGFYFDHVVKSEFTQVMTDNTEVPIYGTTSFNEFTIEIEQSTKFYLFDRFAMYKDKLNVESSATSYNISMSNILELGIDGYVAQFNDIISYQVSLYIPPEIRADFTVISVPRYTRPDESNIIPGYPLFWFWSLIMLGVLISIESYRRIHRR
ncbi:MAG: hypothetical protein ACTSXN_09520 [Promethearchaeota archaeon]